MSPCLSRFACTAVFRHIESSLPGRHRFGQGICGNGSVLDRGATGPLYLSRQEIAKLVVDALQDGDHKLQRYQLHAFVVMPNHVHILVTPKVTSSQWLGPLKGFTAYRANELLGSHGQTFWQDESNDHLVRSEGEFDRIRAYIEENPVTAGLVSGAEQYPWSSAANQTA